MTVSICACGIAAMDCDYHKPEVEPETLRRVTEDEPDTVRFVPDSSPFIFTDGNSTTFVFDDDQLMTVAKRVGDWYYQEQMKAFVGVFGSNG